MIPACDEIKRFIGNLVGSSILLPTQTRICGKRIQENIQRLLNNETPPNIHVVDNLICNGHHRYIAGMMLNLPPPCSPWALPSNTRKLSWHEIEVDCGELWLNFD